MTGPTPCGKCGEWPCKCPKRIEEVIAVGKTLRSDAPVKRPVRLCSFCGRSQQDAAVLIKSKGEEYICDNCVKCCVEIIFEKHAEFENAISSFKLASMPKRKDLVKI